MAVARDVVDLCAADHGGCVVWGGGVARVRGEVVASARRTSGRVEVKNWNEVRVGGQRVELHDPFTFFSPDTYALLNDGKLSS